MNLLQVSGIHKMAGADFELREISFAQQKFQKIAIAGASGSGKSTLLKIIAGLAQPDTGEVLFEGKRVAGPHEKLIPGHPQIAYLSQYFELRHNYRVEELLEYANTGSDRDAKMLYGICQIDHLLHRRTDQLSGGEQQRIALANLLTTAPKLLLLDEPFSNLDLAHKNILKAVIENIGERLQISFLLVSHAPEDMLSWADHILVMKNGRIIQEGPPGDIYRRPVNEYAASLFGKYNLIKPESAAAFPAVSEKEANGRSLFLRPGQLQIAARSPEAVEGRVQKISYLGDAYEVVLRVAETRLTVRTQAGHLAGGDLVYISLLPGEHWYL